MRQITKFSIVASFLGLWINSFFSVSTQISIGFLLIFTFGILHGANDLMLIQKTNAAGNRFNFKKIITLYIISVIIGGFLFYFIPILALTSFIVVSGYHFGEQHWIENLKPHKKIDVFLFLSYGLSILGLLFIFHADEVQKIVSDITQKQIPENFIQIYFFTSLIIFLSTLIYKTIKSRKIQSLIIRELFLLLVLAIIFKTSSLIWGFALYFILWHSLPSLKDQIAFLYTSFSVANAIKYLKSAFLYWMFAIIGIYLGYYLLSEEHIFEALVFSFLASITFPHVWVIISMYKKQNTH